MITNLPAGDRIKYLNELLSVFIHVILKVMHVAIICLRKPITYNFVPDRNSEAND